MSDDIKRFVGDFKIRNDDSSLRVYFAGDVVDYKGNQYVAVKRTSGYTPIHPESRSGWKKMSSNKSINFTNSETEPETPSEGDHWFNSSVGKLFIYIKDKDTEQWVEL